METKLNYYAFDTSKAGDLAQYNELQKRLKKEVTKKPFTKRYAIGLLDLVMWMQSHNGKYITIDTDLIFTDHWHATIEFQNNAAFESLYDWFEFEHNSPKIKEGYYLEQSEAMRNIRDEVYQCVNCGTQFKNLPTPPYCLPCIESDQMTEENLHRTFLRTVSTVDLNIPPQHIWVGQWVVDRWQRTHMPTLERD